MRYHEKFTKDWASFEAYRSAPRLLKCTWSREKYAGIEGHTSIFVILPSQSIFLDKWELRASIFLNVLVLRRRGGTLLVIMTEFGQRFLTSSMRQSYWCETLSDDCVSKSLPPHCNTISLGWLFGDRMCRNRERMWGIVAPGYVNTVPSIPCCCRRVPRPRVRDVPMT